MIILLLHHRNSEIIRYWLISRRCGFAIFSGDVNQDGAVDLSDLSLIDNDVFNFASGYVITDINGDNVTDLADYSLADNNAANFVVKILP